MIISCKQESKTSGDKSGWTFSQAALDADMAEEKAAAYTPEKDANGFAWQVDRFADIKIVRYQVPSFDKLSADQKKLVYYLTQAGLAGRDIFQDQNYRHNLKIRRGLEKIYTSYSGNKNTKGWNAFETYLKRVWFANGIHHHYSSDKFTPDCSRSYLSNIAKECGVNLPDEAWKAMYDPAFDNKKVNQDQSLGLVTGSATNFYDPDITEAEVLAFYEGKVDVNDKTPIELGHNSKLVKKDGKVSEAVWKSGGMYGAAIDEIVGWLQKAVGVAENQKQADALKLLIEFYNTGDLKTWDAYNIAWVAATEGDIDYINSFIEVYDDPLGFRGAYESVIQINDFDQSARMAVVMDKVQWFEDNAPLIEAHKKPNVKGVTYKVVQVAGEAGATSPAGPIGVNLPNNNWIRQEHGSKSVSLGNIVAAYANASGTGMLTEFAHDEREIELEEKYGSVAAKLHTALHEVVGHASGQLEAGIGQPRETLKSYASTMEEGRADLVALYFMRDPELIKMGLMENLEVGEAAYDGYIRNGLLTQLRRLEIGNTVEEAHMRNRQWISKWVFEKGQKDNVIEQVIRDGKTYYNINDYDKLRELFGQLLRESQRIKSQGLGEEAEALVEGYGVKVDMRIHKEVLDRSEKLNIAPYGGFINPQYTMDASGNVSISYPDNFAQQMLHYAKNYSFLPSDN